jgi:hypothetical protein
MNQQSKHTTNNQKAPYISPELRVYGTISELTHALTGPDDDFDGGSTQNFQNTLPPVK